MIQNALNIIKSVFNIFYTFQKDPKILLNKVTLYQSDIQDGVY